MPNVRVVVLSSYAERTDILEALDAGAAGYLLKDAPPRSCCRRPVGGRGTGAARAARRARGASRRGAAHARREDLTARELDVLVLLAEGLPNKVIARRLGIAEKTVKAHVTQIFQTIGVTDRTQAALRADRQGHRRPPGAARTAPRRAELSSRSECGRQARCTGMRRRRGFPCGICGRF